MRMGVYLRDEAIVLAVRPHREADAWISCWTKHHGKHEALATGLRKAQSKQRGHVQPFARIELVLAEGKSFERLTIARMTKDHASALREHGSWLRIASSLARVCDLISVAHAQEEGSDVFQLFLEVQRLARNFRAPFSQEREQFLETLVLERFARLVGYGVAFASCARCRQPLVSFVAFSLSDGGFLCETCQHTTPNFSRASFLTSDEDLKRYVRFFQTAKLEEVVVFSAPRSIFLDLTTIFGSAMHLLPLTTSPFHT